MCRKIRAEERRSSGAGAVCPEEGRNPVPTLPCLTWPRCAPAAAPIPPAQHQPRTWLDTKARSSPRHCWKGRRNSRGKANFRNTFSTVTVVNELTPHHVCVTCVLLPGAMGEHKFSWHDWAWKISFQSIYASIHGNHSSNLHALISLPETVLPSNPGTKMPPCDFPAQSRPTDALKNSNIFQGMSATHGLKKENHPQIHAAAQHHDCIQGGFLLGISQAKISTPTTKKKPKSFRHTIS